MHTRILLFGVLIAALFLTAGLGTRSLPERAVEWERGPNRSKQVALTFDAGGDAVGFPALLKALSDAKADCTFFVTGRWAQHYPELLRQLDQAGHEIGNHSWSHADLTRLSDVEIGQEITRTDALLADLLGKRPKRLFRAPFGSRNSRVLSVVASLGFQSVYWSLDSLDSVGQKKTPEFLINRLMQKTDEELDGSIILMHVGESTTASALPDLINALWNRGFRIVTVSRVMSPLPQTVFAHEAHAFEKHLPENSP